MKCTSCGFDSEQEFAHCPCCGAAAGETVAIVSNPAAEKFLPVLKSSMFLAICILMTCSCAFSLAVGGLSVVNILLTVFTWITYSQARKGIASAKHLRCVSGTVYANYVLANVGAIILIVCGVILAVLMLSTNVVEIIVWEFIQEFPEIYNSDFARVFSVFIGWTVAAVFIVASAISLVFNILGMRKIHRFAKSVYQSINSGSIDLVNPRAAKNWLIVYSVFNGIAALFSVGSSIPAAISSACITAAGIIAVVLINQYFIQSEEQ